MLDDTCSLTALSCHCLLLLTRSKAWFTTALPASSLLTVPFIVFSNTEIRRKNIKLGTAVFELK